MEKGLVQVYTGEGKGKTTAATGLVVRALGQGLRVLLVRFLKPAQPESGEIAFLQGAPGLEILTAGMGIIGGAAPPEAVSANVSAAFEEALDLIRRQSFDLAVFDEINNALHRGYLPLQRVLELIACRPLGLELVFTGRNAPATLCEAADLVTRMEAVKHPFAAGVAARRGIEY